MQQRRRAVAIAGAGAVSRSASNAYKSSAYTLRQSQGYSTKKERLVNELVFYKSFHSHHYNRLIQIFFTFLLFWSFLVLSCNFSKSNLFYDSYWEMLTTSNISTYVMLLYCMYFISFDLISGISWSCFVGLPIWISSVMFHSTIAQSWKWAMAFYVLSWCVQMCSGQEHFDKRVSRLLYICFQEAILAPLFVWFELLFYLGFYSDLKSVIGEKLSGMRNEESFQGTQS